MSVMKFSRKSKLQKFFSSKGFYIALALCLVGSSIAAWISVDRTLNGLEEIGNESTISSTSQPETASLTSAPVEEVIEQQIDVPVSSAAQQQASSKAASVGSQLFIMPVSGSITNQFSNNELVKSKTLSDWRTHDGIDIGCESGTQVKASAKGTVKKVYLDAMWGHCIEIEHENKITTHYYSLSDSISVSEGQAVVAGQVIGTVSDSASAEVLEAMHLHFGMKKDGEWINPLSLITKTN